MKHLLKKLLLPLICLLSLSQTTLAAENPHVLLTTNIGTIELELNPTKAPITVANFLSYVNNGFYNETIFHRVIAGFMVQGGGFTETMQQKTPSFAPIKNEADNGLANQRGTIAMARTNAIDSATSQFFINVADNAFLNHSNREFGYAVFGKVVKGMDVVDKLANIPTTSKQGYSDVPVQPITILSAKQL